LSDTVPVTTPVLRPYGSRSTLGRRVALYTTFALCALGIVTARVLQDSASSLETGDEAARRGDPAEATRHYLHAVRMYVPGSPYVGRGLDRLETLATAAAKGGDTAAERRALEALRSGLLGARSFYTPHAARLEAADRQLASLYARTEDAAVAPGATREEREAWHIAQLSRRPGPATAPAVAALVGLAMWLAAVGVFIRRGLDRALKLRPRWAWIAAVGFFAGFALFVVGLRLA
jgi:hypothetical protein